MRNSNICPRGRSAQRGAIAVLAAIVLMVVVGFMALSLNVGHKMNAKAQLQSAFDAAALAGAETYTGQPPAVAKATAKAVGIAGNHTLDSSAVGLSLSDVSAGYWDKTTKTFYPDGSDVTIGGATFKLDDKAAAYYNAVRVGAITDGAGSHNKSFEVWFGSFLGNPSPFKVAAHAIAVGGGPCQDTGTTLPIAASSCAIIDGLGFVQCGNTPTLGFNGHHLAFINLGGGDPNATSVTGQANAADGAANPTVTFGDNVSLSLPNGVFTDTGQFNATVMSGFSDMFCASPPPYDGCKREQLAVVNIGADCAATLPASAPVVGFVQVVVIGMQVATPPTMTFYIDCNNKSPAPGGCPTFGYRSKTTRLVE